MVTLSFTIFSGQKNYNRAHMLFQVLCGFEPFFYTTHPNEEPLMIEDIQIQKQNGHCSFACPFFVFCIISIWYYEPGRFT